LFAPSRLIFYVYVGILGFSLVLNIFFAFYVFKTEIERTAGKGQWLLDHTVFCTLVIFVSISNVEVLTILDSRIFNAVWSSMKWGMKTHLRVRTFGLIGNMLDNIPQLVIQGYFLSQVGLNAIALASIVVSGVSLLFSIVRRLLIFLVLKFDPKIKKKHLSLFTPDLDLGMQGDTLPRPSREEFAMQQ